MSLGPPYFTCGSASAAYDSNISSLLVRLPDNNQNLILAKDVRDPLWSLWNKIQTVASQSGSFSQSITYTTATPSSVTIGGITEGMTFSDASIQGLFDLMLHPFVTTIPELGIDVAERQFGNNGVLNLSYYINTGSSPISTITFNGPSTSPISPSLPTGNDPDTGYKLGIVPTYSSTAVLSQELVFTMSVVTQDLMTYSATASTTYKHKRYYGPVTIPMGFTPSVNDAAVSTYLTDNIIKGLSFSELSTNVYFSKYMAFSNQYFVFASPTVMGEPPLQGFFMDFLFSTDYTKIKSGVTFSNDYGYKAPYDIWISNFSLNQDPVLVSIQNPNLFNNNFEVPSDIYYLVGPIGPTGIDGSPINNMEVAFGTGTGVTSSNIFKFDDSLKTLNLGVCNNTNSYYNNLIGGKYNTIVSSDNNIIIQGTGSSISYASERNSIINGFKNIIVNGSIENSFIGGRYNYIRNSSNNNVILGGKCNILKYSSCYNLISGKYNSICSGSCESIILGATGSTIKYGSSRSSIIGSNNSQIRGSICNGTIIGGFNNCIFSGASRSNIIGSQFSKIYYGGYDSTILGGICNKIRNSSQQQVILGGCLNTIQYGGCRASISGGFCNKISSGSESSILGGTNNLICSSNCSSIINGLYNTVRYGNILTAIGGSSNSINYGSFNSIISGNSNRICSSQNNNTIVNGNLSCIITGSCKSTIIGGGCNVICNNTSNSTIIGGHVNVINSGFGNISSGACNNNSYSCLSAIFGCGNTNLSSNSSFITGKNNINNNNNYTAIIGGECNKICLSYRSSIIGGNNNSIKYFSRDSVIIGGINNNMCPNVNRGSIIGGYNNCMVCNNNSIILSGSNNYLRGCCSIISGYNNSNSSNSSILLGGYGNINSGNCYSSIIGGELNKNYGNNSHIIGGQGSTSSNYSFIANSFQSLIYLSCGSSIISGLSNIICNSSRSVILGGNGLTLSSENDTVYVPTLKIATASNDNTNTQILTWDTSGVVKYREVSTFTDKSFNINFMTNDNSVIDRYIDTNGIIPSNVVGFVSPVNGYIDSVSYAISATGPTSSAEVYINGTYSFQIDMGTMSRITVQTFNQSILLGDELSVFISGSVSKPSVNIHIKG